MKTGKKCGICAYSRSYARYYDYSMKRMYVKFNRSWKTIGWICPYCLRYELDEEIFKLFFSREQRTIYIRYKKSFKTIGLITYNRYGVMKPKVNIIQKTNLKPEN